MRSALAIVRDLAAACRQGPVAFQIQAAHLAREAEDLVAALDDPGRVAMANPNTKDEGDTQVTYETALLQAMQWTKRAGMMIARAEGKATDAQKLAVAASTVERLLTIVQLQSGSV